VKLNYKILYINLILLIAISFRGIQPHCPKPESATDLPESKEQEWFFSPGSDNPFGFAHIEGQTTLLSHIPSLVLGKKLSGFYYPVKFYESFQRLTFSRIIFIHSNTELKFQQTDIIFPFHWFP
jgi:hypothetical protein